jgi:protein PhnA
MAGLLASLPFLFASYLILGLAGYVKLATEAVQSLPFQANCRSLIYMSTLPACPQCQSEFTYEDGSQFVCPECGHEWSAQAAPAEQARVWRDASGNVLQDGDTVTVIKDLKLKGGGGVVKMGTKVKNIRLVEGDHDIDCKIDGFGSMGLKTEFVRKA